MKLLGFLKRRESDGKIPGPPSVRPTPEEAKKWATSFQALMASKCKFSSHQLFPRPLTPSSNKSIIDLLNPSRTSVSFILLLNFKCLLINELPSLTHAHLHSTYPITVS